MATAGLYRRALPSPPAISFSSGEGKQLFREALQEGTMEGFFSLISHFQTQSEPAYCGLASLAMVLNALAIDPGRKWRGPWRWFDESMLDCCQPLEKVKVKGVTFGTVACLALCAGAKVEAFRTDDLTVTDFRSNIVRCASSQDIHLIASYHRRSFKQTGTGHFSPIGGYHAGKDMVLILDVARFKYPPHWVPLTLLWEAMDTIDEDTDRRRGFMVISKVQMSPCALHALSCRDESWVRMAKYLIEDIPRLLESKNLKTISEVLSLVLEALPIDCRDLLKQDSAASGEEKKNILSTEDEGRLAPKEVLQQVHETELYKRAKKYISSSMCYPENDSNGKDLFVGTLLPAESKEGDLCPSPKSLPPVNLSTFTLLLLASPPVTWSRIKHEGLLEEIQNVFSIESLPDHVKEEVLHLRMRLHFLKRCKDNEVDEEDCSHLSCCRYGR